MQKNPYIVTAAIAALIVVTAMAVLGVMAAFEGQTSGLDKSSRAHCPKLSAKQAKDVTNPDYGKHLARLAHCQ
jgi:hypothetical protein